MTNNDIHRFLAAALEIYIQTSRRTGRTLEMLKAANPGDVVVTAQSNHALHLHRFLRSTGTTDIEVMACPVNCSNLFDQTHNRGFNAIHLDHTWIEEFYRNELSLSKRGLQSVLDPNEPSKPEPLPNWSAPLSDFQLTRLNPNTKDHG